MDRKQLLRTTWGLVLLLAWSVAAFGQGKVPRPGWNLFSPEQDVEMGKEAVAEVEKEVIVVDDPTLTKYVSNIGAKIVKVSPGAEYPYHFQVIADPNINAFALPGGPIYINSGLITSAKNEAQLASVMAHEIGHVALRHSTNRVSKAYAWQLPLALASGALGQKGGVVGVLTQLGVGFGLNSLFMKYSRSAEKDADIFGVHMLADVGYDPMEMSRFFGTLEAATAGKTPPQFFSDHPNPGNRREYVADEVQYVAKKSYTVGDAREFKKMQQRAEKANALAKSKAPAQPAGEGSAATGTPGQYGGTGYQVSFPKDWKAYENPNGGTVTIVPGNGIVQTADGKQSLARGIMAGYFGAEATRLSAATDELIKNFQQSNPALQPIRGQRRDVKVSGEPGQSILLSSQSAVEGADEVVWMITAQRQQGLFYLVMVSPDKEYNQLRETFQQTVNNVQWK